MKQLTERKQEDGKVKVQELEDEKEFEFVEHQPSDASGFPGPSQTRDKHEVFGP
jgi:hypothetical protein